MLQELLDKRRALSKAFRDIMDNLKVKLAGVKKAMEAQKTFEDLDHDIDPSDKEEEVCYTCYYEPLLVTINTKNMPEIIAKICQK